MTNAIVECVGRRRFATFQDLTREVVGFSGTLGMFAPTAPAIIIWHAVSQEGIAALGGLIGTQKIFMHPAPAISYRADLDYPALPRCRDFDREGQGPEIKWLPVVFTITSKRPARDQLPC